MRTQQIGFGVVQFLVAVAVVAAVYIMAMPGEDAAADVEKAIVADALNLADESKRRIVQSYGLSHALPRTAGEAETLISTDQAEPQFVKDIHIQHDYAGETVMIMVYLRHGAVDNLLGGEQYVYLAGIRSSEHESALEWQCGARNVDLALLPEQCRS